MKNITVGFAMCGSFCTFKNIMPVLKSLCDSGYNVVPIMSQAAAFTDTRFGKAEDFRRMAEEYSGKAPITSIAEAEPIGPKALLDVLVVAPATGNTIGKLANGITDTPVTMAVKSHLRNRRPVVIAVSTNDALGAAAQNIGKLRNMKNIYFVPMRQDNPVAKPNSLVADFSMIEQSMLAALEGRQLPEA